MALQLKSYFTAFAAGGANSPQFLPLPVINHHHAPAVRREHAVAQLRAAILPAILQEMSWPVHLKRDLRCGILDDDVDPALRTLAPSLVGVRHAHARQACRNICVHASIAAASQPAA